MLFYTLLGLTIIFHMFIYDGYIYYLWWIQHIYFTSLFSQCFKQIKMWEKWHMIISKLIQWSDICAYAVAFHFLWVCLSQFRKRSPLSPISSVSEGFPSPRQTGEKEKDSLLDVLLWMSTVAHVEWILPLVFSVWVCFHEEIGQSEAQNSGALLYSVFTFLGKTFGLFLSPRKKESL